MMWIAEESVHTAKALFPPRSPRSPWTRTRALHCQCLPNCLSKCPPNCPLAWIFPALFLPTSRTLGPPPSNSLPKSHHPRPTLLLGPHSSSAYLLTTLSMGFPPYPLHTSPPRSHLSTRPTPIPSQCRMSNSTPIDQSPPPSLNYPSPQPS